MRTTDVKVILMGAGYVHMCSIMRVEVVVSAGDPSANFNHQMIHIISR